jgi:hypothetical protein
MPPGERESLPARIQARLSRLYGLAESPSVDDFIEASDHEDREVMVIVDRGDGSEVELSLRLPRTAVEGQPSFDQLCQIVEGVSHFLYVVERARRELPATQLELELQAEVDKYVLLAHGPALATGPARFEAGRAARIRQTLFDRVSYVDPAGTETGDRYRFANDLAAGFAARLEKRFARHGRFEQMRAALRRFYCAGQAEKIELARAA